MRQGLDAMYSIWSTSFKEVLKITRTFLHDSRQAGGMMTTRLYEVLFLDYSWELAVLLMSSLGDSWRYTGKIWGEDIEEMI